MWKERCWQSGSIHRCGKTPSFGGTLARRLSKEEYQNTIRILFDLPDYQVPLGFPDDSTRHGFNNTGEGLIMSPTLLGAYLKVANQVADELIPVKKIAEESSIRVLKPDDMVANYAAAAKYNNALRFASSGTQIMRSCSWPKRMTVNSSGIYKITVRASSFLPRSRNLMPKGAHAAGAARERSGGRRARDDSSFPSFENNQRYFRIPQETFPLKLSFMKARRFWFIGIIRH